mgnify:CR=1 FL=1
MRRTDRLRRRTGRVTALPPVYSQYRLVPQLLTLTSSVRRRLFGCSGEPDDRRGRRTGILGAVDEGLGQEDPADGYTIPSGKAALVTQLRYVAATSRMRHRGSQQCGDASAKCRAPARLNLGGALLPDVALQCLDETVRKLG